MRRPGGSRERILDAAERIVVDEGARSLTLDAVAARAGVSKGGLLYHFGTKEALLQAMLDRRCSSFELQIGEQVAAKGGAAGALAAYVSVALQRNVGDSIAGALIAALANDPRLLDPMRAHLRRWVPQLDPTAPGFADRAIVWLATEGLWLLELLQLSPLTERQRAAIAARLVQLTRDEELGGSTPGAAARQRMPASAKAARRRSGTEVQEGVR